MIKDIYNVFLNSDSLENQSSMEVWPIKEQAVIKKEGKEDYKITHKILKNMQGKKGKNKTLWLKLLQLHTDTTNKFIGEKNLDRNCPKNALHASKLHIHNLKCCRHF